jgi:hypothetical protein
LEAVHIGGADCIDLLVHGRSFAEKPHLVLGVQAMLEELAWWTHALRQRRAESTARRSAA